MSPLKRSALGTFERMPFSTDTPEFKKVFDELNIYDKNGVLLSVNDLVVEARIAGFSNTNISTALKIDCHSIPKILVMMKKPELIHNYRYDAEQKKQALSLYADGFNPTQIQEKTGITAAVIYYWVKKHKISRSIRECHGVNEKDILVAIQMYIDGMGSRKISSCLGYAPGTILNWIKESGIKKRTGLEAYGTNEKDIPVAIKMYCDGMSFVEIAKKLGYSNGTISDWVRKAGIKIRTVSESRGISKEDVKTALKMYSVGISALAIGKSLGISNVTVINWVKNSGIKTRTLSESQGIRVFQGRGSNLSGIRSVVITRFGKIRSESTYEAIRILQLNNDKSVIDIERAKTIPRGKGTYTPDLRIVYRDGTVVVEEIKPLYMINDTDVLDKARVATEYYKDKNTTYRIITEKDIGIAGFTGINKTLLVFKNQNDARRFNGSASVAKSFLKKMMREDDVDASLAS